MMNPVTSSVQTLTKNQPRTCIDSSLSSSSPPLPWGNGRAGRLPLEGKFEGPNDSMARPAVQAGAVV
jgi:hypothetical protein